MKNIKCKIGATILTPIFTACFVGFLWLMGYLATKYYELFMYFMVIISIVTLLIVFSVIWFEIYDFCVRNSKK